MKYRANLILAKKLTKNQYANHEYYNHLSFKLEKLLAFYENLKDWERNYQK